MKAEFINHMGTDLTVVNSARVSFDKESQFDGEELCHKDIKLIRYLACHGHWTPFSHPMITMRETVPIFVARQRFKHMVGFTYNEVSRRYVDDRPEFFRPKAWRARPDASIKQGSGDEIVTSMGRTSICQDGDPHNEYEVFLEAALELYNDMLDAGIAPEQARMVLPQSMYTSYYVTGSLAAWARAYVQRIDAHAQMEIQHLAREWDTIIRPLFPNSWEALVCHSTDKE